MTQDCLAAAETIPPLLDGELSRREAASAVAHLGACPPCLLESSAQARSWLAFERANPPPPVPAELRLWRPQRAPFFLRPAAWALAAAALLIMAAPRAMRRPPSQPQVLPVVDLPAAALSHPPLNQGRVSLAAAPLRSGRVALSHPPKADGGLSLSVAPLSGEFSGAIPVAQPFKPKKQRMERRQA